MDRTKSHLIKLALDCQVLQFGQFTLKSGRQSPYFFNAGLFYQGHALRFLGDCYARLLLKHQVHFDHLFGPAYKGLPLATATAVSLDKRGIKTTVTFNRKEVKRHGEGGELIGAPLWGKTVIIDDVVTAGTAFYESKKLIEKQGAVLKALILLFDRCERGLTKQSTVSEIKAQGIEVYSMLNLYDVIEYLKTNNQTLELKQIEHYLEEYASNE